MEQQGSDIITNRYQKFIKTVCETDIVYALQNHEGFATSASVQYDDENDRPVGVLCFWAESGRAKSCSINHWANYQLTEISLTDFIENWGVGMENDGILAGIEFDQNMFGYEAKPLDLILDLVTEIKTTKKSISLQKFDGIADLEEQAKVANG
ncbi:DUF2750 domain-containing protein [Maribacter stanieri]|uniref:DUF2750 domain-containing protein n=1 Tax=Maribacter stanieri TaxID=440514 RepID=A0A1I6KD26_9FLAO|nr:DUF2750 domain-containing protein [Maribacter stanieri]SFR89153.1 Protein of unknown function [Maribacter stanieri]